MGGRGGEWRRRQVHTLGLPSYKMFFIVKEMGKLSRNHNQTWDPELTEILKIKKFFLLLYPF